MDQRSRAFTLIELLIVVAIIAILAAIAVPNFLEAQVRAKVSRAKSDQRTLATAFEAYRVDTNKYPTCPVISGLSGINAPQVVRMKYTNLGNDKEVFDGYWPTQVTSPIAYLTTLPIDPFPTRVWDATSQLGAPQNLNNGGYARNHFVFIFNGGRTDLGLQTTRNDILYSFLSPGPSKAMVLGFEFNDGGRNADATYDPTNGTVSVGDVLRFGPG